MDHIPLRNDGVAAGVRGIVSKRIGEALIERALLTPGELDKALKAQLIFGGHLGTNLIELGLVDEDALGRCLADLLGVRHATRKLLAEATPEALGVLSREAAERYRCVPLIVEGGALHLAAADPRDLGAMSSATGYRLVPYVAPEVRIYEALERYYGIPRRARYINLSYELAGRPPAGRRQGVVVSRPQASAADEQSAPVVTPDPEPVPHAAETTDLGAEFGYGKSWRELADELDEAPDRIDLPESDAEDVAARKEPPTRRARTSGATIDESQAVECLVAANEGDEIAAAFLDWAGGRGAGAVLFAVKGSTARVWDWRGLGLSQEGLKRLRFGVTAGSIFTLLLGEGFYRGPAPDDVNGRSFYGAMRVEPPEEIVLLPVHLDDRLVAIVYVEGDAERALEASDEELRRMTRRLAQAMSLVILKRRIRAG